jgi:hypothetical protein
LATDKTAVDKGGVHAATLVTLCCMKRCMVKHEAHRTYLF